MIGSLMVHKYSALVTAPVNNAAGPSRRLGRENARIMYTRSDFGNLKLRMKNVKKFPFILQILNDSGEIVGEKYCTNETEMYFEAIQPSSYQVRLFYDENKNQIWDTGDFKKKLQPEEMIYFPTLIDVRANWDVDQELELD